MFLVLIFLAEVGVGVVSYILYTQVTEAPIADHIDNVFISQWGSDPAVTRAINNIQMEVRFATDSGVPTRDLKDVLASSYSTLTHLYIFLWFLVSLLWLGVVL